LGQVDANAASWYFYCTFWTTAFSKVQWTKLTLFVAAILDETPTAGATRSRPSSEVSAVNLFTAVIVITIIIIIITQRQGQ
jgi:hypothetical protein